MHVITLSLEGGSVMGLGFWGFFVGERIVLRRVTYAHRRGVETR